MVTVPPEWKEEYFQRRMSARMRLLQLFRAQFLELQSDLVHAFRGDAIDENVDEGNLVLEPHERNFRMDDPSLPAGRFSGTMSEVPP